MQTLKKVPNWMIFIAILLVAGAIVVTLAHPAPWPFSPQAKPATHAAQAKPAAKAAQVTRDLTNTTIGEFYSHPRLEVSVEKGSVMLESQYEHVMIRDLVRGSAVHNFALPDELKALPLMFVGIPGDSDAATVRLYNSRSIEVDSREIKFEYGKSGECHVAVGYVELTPEHLKLGKIKF